MKTMQPIPLFIEQQPMTAAAEAAPALIPLQDLGTIYSMAQEVRWLDERTFAIGRWDGMLTVFHCGKASVSAPIISAALVAPSLAGVEMIGALTDAFPQ